MSDTASGLVDAFMSKMNNQREAGENEYLGEDGLLYCKKCRTAVQYRLDMNGREAIVGVICKCRQEELAQEEKRRQEEEHIRRIRQLKANGIQEKHLLDWNFEVAEDGKDIQMAKRYVENWTKVRADNLGLLLWGEVGSGKSFLAACIANALLEQGIPVLMTNFSKILNQMGAMYSEERYRYIASFSNFSLLIIDDLGIERSTEYALEQVYAVVDERYKSGLPLIITTNLTIAELRNPVDVPHARIYSRILEMCTPVNVRGGDRRKAISQSKRDVVKEVLDL
ncbi:MAG: ATP-binding protein [Eubacteriales bacterium]|nr:ATP-binding protein [Eubacteriales bacterium]